MKGISFQALPAKRTAEKIKFFRQRYLGEVDVNDFPLIEQPVIRF